MPVEWEKMAAHEDTLKRTITGSKLVRVLNLVYAQLESD